MAHILVVDDSEDIRLALVTILADAGHEVSEAADGLSVIPTILENRPDVVLLDVAMPHKNGFESLKELKADERTKDIPVIMVTAKGRPEDLTTSLALGASDYISKPWADGEVEIRVEKALQANIRTGAESAG